MRYLRRELLAGAVGALAAVALLGAGTLVLRNDGIQFPDGSLQANAGVELVDSVGTTVGPIAGVALTGNAVEQWVDYMVVALRIDQEVVFLRASGGGLRIGGYIQYQLPDCQGTAAISQGAGRYAVDHENVLYGQSGGFLSDRLSYSNGSSCINDASSGTWFVASPMVDLDDLFTPPFYIE